MKTKVIATMALLVAFGSGVGLAEDGESACAPAAMSFSEYLQTVPAVLELEPPTTFGEMWPHVALAAAPRALPGTLCEARCLAAAPQTETAGSEDRLIACLAGCTPSV